MQDTLQLIEDVDSLKALLEDAAMYQRDMDEGQYRKLKAKLVGISRIQPFLPSFLKSRPTLSSFRSLAQENPRYAQRRSFIQTAFESVLEYLHDELRNPIGASITDVLIHVDSTHVVQACQKAMDRVYDDPDGAITSARSLLETVCKHILDEQSAPYNRTADLPDLYKAATRVMALAPDQQSESDMRQTLQGCLSVVQGVGALRNRIGDAHGKSAVAGVVERRHAILGVGVACSVASFLMESWEKHSET